MMVFIHVMFISKSICKSPEYAMKNKRVETNYTDCMMHNYSSSGILAKESIIK
jgi:hypothetical protein